MAVKRYSTSKLIEYLTTSLLTKSPMALIQPATNAKIRAPNSIHLGNLDIKIQLLFLKKTQAELYTKHFSSIFIHIKIYFIFLNNPKSNVLTGIRHIFALSCLSQCINQVC